MCIRDRPRFISEVYDLPASEEQLHRIEQALRLRETVRERLFAGPAPTPSVQEGAETGRR